MQIVIDIDEKDYQLMKNGHVPFNVLGVLMSGTPLPKGHGRLIDADALNFNADYYEPLISKLDFDHAPTIIEADKEDKE